MQVEIHFDQHLLSLNNRFFSPEEAIRYAGTLLHQAQACNEQYIDAMIEVYHEFGSIIVLDDGVAIPHARPEKGALKTAFSVVIVKEPLIFHHEEFDPVYVIMYAWCLAVKAQFENQGEHDVNDPRKVITKGMLPVAEQVEERMRLFGSAGRAI